MAEGRQQDRGAIPNAKARYVFGDSRPFLICLDKENIMSLSPDLLEILACPKCKGELHLLEDESGLSCDACRLTYPIRDDIPVMLIDEAEPFQDG